MNCECLTNTEKKLLDNYNANEKNKKKALSASIEKGFIFGKKLQTITYSNVAFQLEGQKKECKLRLFHSFCPFCGIKIERDNPEENNS